MTAGISAGLAAGAVLALASVAAFESYGIALFLGTPFAVGAVSAAVMVRRYPAHWTDRVSTAVLAITFLGGACLLLAFEGLICIAMAYPLALVLGVLGAGSVHLLSSSRPGRPSSIAGLLLIPLAAGLEPVTAPPPVVHEVRSSVEIAASPDVVWRHVVSFAPLAEPTAWLFRLGVAYPIEATIAGEGVGAVRYCVFSTGAFVEPITRWEPGRRLSFDVVASPRPLVELSPYGAIAAPHLDGFLRSRRGEFRLVPRPDGGTRLEGSTWYELRMAPEGYWQLYADGIIGRIHTRVLEHIKAEAERRPAG
jgi:hypothetical protein